MNDPLVGREIDGYRIEKVLGRGGMGMVYEAEDVALRRPVAIKRINPGQAHSETFLRRFRSEARALARIDSEYIVRIYALRETDIGLLIVMEYVDGGTIDDVIEEDRLDAWDEGIIYVKQSLLALEAAHKAGVIHRDIKPQNIMLTSGGTVKVTDFGLAKLTRKENETVTHSVGGTLKYMSPEQIEHPSDIDYRSDLYSMGMTAYELFAGHLPFESSAGDFSIMRAIVEAEIPTIETFAPHLPQPLIDIITRATARDADDRYQSARAMLEDIEAFEVAWHAREDGDSVLAPPLQTTSPDLDGETILDDLSNQDTVIEAPPSPGYGGYGGASAGPGRGSAGYDGGQAPVAGSTPYPGVPAANDGNKWGSSISPMTMFDEDSFGMPAATTMLEDEAEADEEEGGSRTRMAVLVGLLIMALAGGAYVVFVQGDAATDEPSTAAATTPQGTAPSQEQGAPAQGAAEPGTTPPEPAPAATPSEPASSRQEAPSSSSEPTSSEPVAAEASSEPAADEPVAAASSNEPPAASQPPPSTDTAPASSTPSSSSRTAPTGALSVTPAEDGVRIFIDGQPRSGSGTFEVPQGSHTVRCQHPSYAQVAETTVTVTPGDAKQLTCYFERRVQVTTGPNQPWGNVVLNGQNTKEETPHPLMLGPGTHRISLSIDRLAGARVTSGIVRTNRGRERLQNTFIGGETTIEIQPSFTETKYVVQFDIKQ
jgi:serine/threonine protein kinase